jgi:ferredoxin
MFLPPDIDRRGNSGRIGFSGGTLFASSDAVALDTVVSELTGHVAESDPVLSAAADAGLGIGRKEGIRVRYLTGKPKLASNLPIVASSTGRRFYGVAMGLMSSALTARLEIDRSRCTACGVCVNNCHIKGLAENSNHREPIWRESVCVHCWTCVENCPQGALDIRWGLLSGGAFSLWRKICDG